MQRVRKEGLRTLSIILFIFISFSIRAEVNPCLVDAKASTNPLSPEVEKSITDITPQRCTDKIHNFELESKDQVCNCFKPYLKDIKKKTLLDEESKVEQVGMALMTEYQEITNMFSELRVNMPSLGATDEIFESCGISKPFEFETPGCNLKNDKTKARMAKLFKFYQKDNNIIGVKGFTPFSVNKLMKKLKDETFSYIDPALKPAIPTNRCTHPSFDFFVKKKEIENFLTKENKEELYRAVIDGEVNNFKPANYRAFFNLLKTHADGSVDSKGMSLLKSEWDKIQPADNGDMTSSAKLKRYLTNKLMAKCEHVNKKFETAICSDSLGALDKTVPEEDKINYFYENDYTSDVENLENNLGKVKTLCSKSTEGNSFDAFIHGILGQEQDALVAYQGQGEASVLVSSEIKRDGLCSSICDKSGEIGADGYCKKRNLDEVYKELGCSSVAKDDLQLKKKCRFVSLLREDDTIKEIKGVIARSDISSAEPDKVASVSEQLRIHNSNNKPNDLLTRYLASKEEKAPVVAEKKENKAPSSSSEKERKPLATKMKVADDSVKKTAPKKRQVAKVSEARKTEINMEAALNRLETAKGSLSFGRSSKGRSGSSSKSSSSGNDQISAASDRLDSLLNTLDELKKDNSNIDTLISNLNNNPAYGAGTGNDSNNGAGSSYTRRRPTQLANNGAAGGAGSFGSAPSSAGGLPSESSISNPSGGEYVGDIARTDLVGKSSTGVSSPEDGDFSAQTAPGVRKPASLGRGGEAGSSDISKLFQGRLEASKVSDNTNTSNLVQVEVKKGVKEVNLAELLKNRDEINPGEAFILYEVVQNKKIEVTLIPTFSNYKGKRFFAGYRPLDVNGNNRILVEKLKAERNLLTQN